MYKHVNFKKALIQVQVPETQTPKGLQNQENELFRKLQRERLSIDQPADGRSMVKKKLTEIQEEISPMTEIPQRENHSQKTGKNERSSAILRQSKYRLIKKLVGRDEVAHNSNVSSRRNSSTVNIDSQEFVLNNHDVDQVLRISTEKSQSD